MRTLESFFETTLNCFECALALTHSASDFGKTRPHTQSFTIMCVFKEWVLQHPDRYSILTSELKARALETVLSTRGSSALVDVVCQAYRLEEDAYSYMGYIRDLLQKQFFNEASTLVIRLNLQQQFQLREIAVPLFLLDKLSLLDNYLADHPDLQEEMVRYLDRLYKDSRPVRSLVRSLNLKDNGKAKLHPKTLGKAISRMLKQYDLPADTCRNVQSSRSKRAMKYLIHKRYDELEYSGPSWREMVLQVVQDNEDLHLDLVRELMDVNEYESALGFALRLNLPEERWPAYLYQFRHSYYPKDLTQDMLPAWRADDVSKDTGLFLQLELDLSVVHMVDTAEDFFSCIEVLKTYDVIGMDAEWQPTMGLGPIRLSVVQLAVRDCVYILDMLALAETLTEKDWDLLYTEILAASRIKKLGYGIADDVKLVMETAQSPHAMFDNVVDLSKFAQKLRKDYPTLLKPVNPTAMQYKGLSELTRLVLGMPLNKDEQCSDWENRPLREAQLKYAALDAFCLLQIYDELHCGAREENLDVEVLFEGVRPVTEVHKKAACKPRPPPESWD